MTNSCGSVDVISCDDVAVCPWYVCFVDCGAEP